MPQQTWLITGCSSGFGEQFVRQLTELGDNVVASGRHAETRLAHLKDTGATIIDLDVTAPQREIDSKFHEALAAYGSIDVIVNNAGFIQAGPLEDLRCAPSLVRWKEIIARYHRAGADTVDTAVSRSYNSPSIPMSTVPST